MLPPQITEHEMSRTVKLGYSDPTSPSGWRELSSSGGKFDVINQKYLLAMLEGDIVGHTNIVIDARNQSINTLLANGEQTLWPVPPATQAQYVWPVAASTLTVVSDDATDNQAGVGARSVFIEGILDGGLADTETLPLHPTDGTIAVTTAKSWYRVNKVTVVTAGSSGKNAGNLTIKHGTDIVSYVSEGANISFVGVYTVPIDLDIYIDNAHGDGAGTKDVHIMVYCRQPGELFLKRKHRSVNNSQFEMTCVKLPGGTDIEVRCYASVNGGIGDITIEGWTE